MRPHPSAVNKLTQSEITVLTITLLIYEKKRFEWYCFN